MHLEALWGKVKVGGQVRTEFKFRLYRVVALTLDYIAPACGQFSGHMAWLCPVETQNSWQRYSEVSQRSS